MHTKELARALRAFAGIADFDRSQELHRFAVFLERGRNETIAARLKRSTPSAHYPLLLKESLEAIEIGLRAAGAIKPSIALSGIQRLFAGRPDATVDAFLAEVSVPPQLPDANARRFKSANSSLAKSMCSDLVAVIDDAPVFQARLAELASSAPAGTATWTLVANQFIGNRRAYRDRKAAIRAIKTYFDGPVTERDECPFQSVAIEVK
jgi:hypothetical protein